MPRARNLFAVAVVVLLISSGCAGGGSSPTAPSSPTPAAGLSNGTMTATVDGTPWAASRFLTVQYQPNVAPFMIMGSDSLGTVLTISFTAYRTGTFTTCSDLTCAFMSLQTNVNGWTAGPLAGSSGTVFFSVLTAHNAVGTFSFVGVDAKNTKKSVTNGAFNVTY